MQSTYKGKFCKSNVIKWRKNVIQSNKSRHTSTSCNSTEITGPRLVDMQLLSKDLWCHYCNKVLSLRDTVRETRNGLASVFYVKCTTCKKICQVNTLTNEPTSSTRPTYCVNSKIVNDGVIESGIDNTHLNKKILSAAEIPVMYSTVFKRHERKVGTAIEKLAKESCLENLQAEREITIENEGNDSSKNNSPTD